MNDFLLTQNQIDELIEAINNNSLDTWKANTEKLISTKIRFRDSNIYMAEDYDLFYCTYPLEDLTISTSILRRYAYMDNKTFRSFKYFIMIEDYRYKEINAAAVVGVLPDILYNLNYDFGYQIEKGKVYLADISSLVYVKSLNNTNFIF